MEEKKPSMARVIFWAGIALFVVVVTVVLLFNIGPFLWLRVMNAFNPMQLSFLESFYIVNSSGERIEVMPIGMLEGSGRYGHLPRYRNSFPPAIRISASQPINLAPEAEAKVTYDYDDINFRHILIRDQMGNTYILDTDKKGTISTSYGPQKDRYIIPSLKETLYAPKELIPCFNGEYVTYKEGFVEYH
jgi:hypothetical protein